MKNYSNKNDIDTTENSAKSNKNSASSDELPTPIQKQISLKFSDF